MPCTCQASLNITSLWHARLFYIKKLHLILLCIYKNYQTEILKYEYINFIENLPNIQIKVKLHMPLKKLPFIKRLFYF